MHLLTHVIHNTEMALRVNTVFPVSGTDSGMTMTW